MIAQTDDGHGAGAAAMAADNAYRSADAILTAERAKTAARTAAKSASVGKKAKLSAASESPCDIILGDDVRHPSDTWPAPGAPDQVAAGDVDMTRLPCGVMCPTPAVCVELGVCDFNGLPLLDYGRVASDRHTMADGTHHPRRKPGLTASGEALASTPIKLSTPQRDALRALATRTGEAVIDTRGGILCAGEMLNAHPVTILRLVTFGLIEPAGRCRLRLTAPGRVEADRV